MPSDHATKIAELIVEVNDPFHCREVRLDNTLEIIALLVEAGEGLKMLVQLSAIASKAKSCPCIDAWHTALSQASGDQEKSDA